MDLKHEFENVFVFFFEFHCLNIAILYFLFIYNGIYGHIDITIVVIKAFRVAGSSIPIFIAKRRAKKK